MVMRLIAGCHLRWWFVWLSIILIGCDKATTQVQGQPTTAPAQGGVATPTFTSTATPLPALPWRNAQIAPYNDWVFAPSNGNIGYDCSFDTTANTAIMAITHDRGVHFSKTPAPVANGEDRCEVTVDVNDAGIVVVRLWGTPLAAALAHNSMSSRRVAVPHAAPGDQEISDYITLDGGQHWHPIPTTTIINLFASIGNRIYAIICTNRRFGGEAIQCDVQFVVSYNGMQSWQQLSLPPSPQASAANDIGDGKRYSASSPTISQYGTLPQLFADPFSGDLLYADNDPKDGHVIMLRSTDGGDSWNTIAEPQPMQQFVFSLPGEHHLMTLCFAHDTAIWCSADIGRTWQQRTITNSFNFNEYNGAEAHLGGIASNGDLLMETTSQSQISRLTPRGTAWQLVGDAPGDGATLYGPVGANLLWVVNPSTLRPEGDQWYSLAYA
jgi:hypothetical protein